MFFFPDVTCHLFKAHRGSSQRFVLPVDSLLNIFSANPHLPTYPITQLAPLSTFLTLPAQLAGCPNLLSSPPLIFFPYNHRSIAALNPTRVARPFFHAHHDAPRDLSLFLPAKTKIIFFNQPLLCSTQPQYFDIQPYFLRSARLSFSKMSARRHFFRRASQTTCISSELGLYIIQAGTERGREEEAAR